MDATRHGVLGKYIRLNFSKKTLLEIELIPPLQEQSYFIVVKENLTDGEMGAREFDDFSFVCFTLVALNPAELIFSQYDEVALQL